MDNEIINKMIVKGENRHIQTDKTAYLMDCMHYDIPMSDINFNNFSMEDLNKTIENFISTSSFDEEDDLYILGSDNGLTKIELIGQILVNFNEKTRPSPSPFPFI